MILRRLGNKKKIAKASQKYENLDIREVEELEN